MTRGKVVRRKRDAEGNPIVRANNNPILDTRQYEIQFVDGEVTELTANAIAEAMFARCVEAWAMSPAQYVHQSVKNVETYLEENLSARWKLPSRAENPFAVGYSPELDDSPELDPSLSSYYQPQIGILR